mgnify:CR=1 FL=1
MRKDIYKYKGISFKPVKKDVAEKMIIANPNRKFFMVGSNVNQFHFHKGWFLATHIDTLLVFNKRHSFEIDNEDFFKGFKKSYNAMSFYLEPELGRYPIYYVEII